MSNLVPDGWSIATLGEFASIKGGKRLPKGETFSAVKTDFPYIRVTDFSNGSVSLIDLRYVTDEIREKIKRYVISSDDLYISIAGTLGLVGEIPHQLNGALLTENAAKIVFNEKTISDKSFYKFYLNSNDAQDHFNQAKGTGGGVPKLALFRIQDTPVLVPPFHEQRKIAAILSSVDEVIEKIQAQIDKLKDLKTGMMQELLTKGIGHTEFKDSPVGSIPVGWRVVSIGELLSSSIISSVQDGNHGEKHPKSADFVPAGIPFVMASDIHDQEIDVEGSNKITEETYNGLRIGFSVAGDVLLSHKATVGLTAVVPENIKRIMLTPQVTYYRIADQSKLYNWYLHYCFQSGYFQERLSVLSAQSTRSYIGIKAQADMLIALPCGLAEQHKIVDVLKSLDSKTRLIKAKINTLKNTKKALVQDLLTGKVRVNTEKSNTEVAVG